MHKRLEVAMNAVDFEIDYLTETARLIAFATRDNHNLIEAIEEMDRDRIGEISNALKDTAQLDFCTVVDSEGIVIKRVHEPDRYGDSLASLKHIEQAIEGNIESYIVPGVTIELGIMAGSPIVDNSGDIIGAISLGYMMDIQSFTYNLKNHTGCDVTIFRDDVVISSTILDETGHTDLGGKAREDISRIVLAGGTYTGTINLFGNEILGLYHPLYGADNDIVGMTFVGFETAEDMNKIRMFIIIGAIITLIVLGFSLIIARALSGVIERRLESMVEDVHQAREDLLVARDAAESASEAKSIFLANMSHEIRTPMNSIIGFAELAGDGDISEETRGYLGNIRTSSDVLLNIINDILDISKIESGKIELEQIPFSLFDIFEHCQNSIMPIITEKSLTLYCYTEPLPGKRLIGDPFRLRQIIMNLLTNAVKFTNVGMIKALSSIISKSKGKAAIRFEVKDSGIGISPENINDIFKPFAQADDSVTRRFGGTGLGLTITRNIVDLMGGVLEVKSDYGIGSTFTFELEFELVDETDDSEYDVVTGQDLKKPIFNGEALICDDNALNLQVICEHLSRVGVKTFVACNGKEGVDIVKKRKQNDEKPFDIIFMDIHMPVMDGIEAATLIKDMGIESPIVALTANVMSQDIILYKEKGMPDTLGKPFTSQELWNCLLKYLPVIDSVSASNENLDEDD
ncbi:MAG: ATP-binding protein [Oscillospiraceae bacterium]|nr:ATP-binding protein [Oscillospiraceae bacterium]